MPQIKYVPYMSNEGLAIPDYCIVMNIYPYLHACSEYAAYTTTIRETPLKCSIRSRDNHILQAIPTIGGDPRILYLFSPGYGQQESVH